MLLLIVLQVKSSLLEDFLLEINSFKSFPLRPQDSCYENFFIGHVDALCQSFSKTLFQQLVMLLFVSVELCGCEKRDVKAVYDKKENTFLQA